MKLFKCPCCGQLLDFDNVSCIRCGHRLGYIPQEDLFSALDPEGEAWRSLAHDRGLYRFCANAEPGVCNWLLPAETPDRFCLACRHNRTIPNLDEAGALAAWQQIERAKHRLFYSLVNLGLPIPAQGEAVEPLVFDFLGEGQAPGGPKVMTGHDNGVVTIALAEANDAERERRRSTMGEPYRTLLGHFRHEVGHFYWDLLVRDGGKLEACRAVFGDERADYGEALKRHYEQGAPEGWSSRFISAYATTHAWEDFAETWAHYLHIVDCVEMASALGLGVAPAIEGGDALSVRADLDPYGAEASAADLVGTWVPVSFALNAMNRCMGQPDLYPFVLSPAVIGKLAFVHDLVRAGRTG